LKLLFKRRKEYHYGRLSASFTYPGFRHSGLRTGKHQLKAQSQKLKANSNPLSAHNLVHVLELDVIPGKRP